MRIAITLHLSGDETDLARLTKNLRSEYRKKRVGSVWPAVTGFEVHREKASRKGQLELFAAEPR
jgi:hypothetical protein